MTTKKGTAPEVKAAAERAEARSEGKPVDMPTSPLNPPVHAGGRPPDYRPEYADIAAKLYARGFTDEEMADALGCSVRTLFRWRAKYPEFSQAVTQGKDTPDDRAERTLYLRAIGYSYQAEKVLKNGEVVSYLAHMPPDPTCLKFWLTNRRSAEWRERKEVEIGRPGDFAAMEHDKLLESVQADLAEFGGALLEHLPASPETDTPKARNRVKGNGTQH